MEAPEILTPRLRLRALRAEDEGTMHALLGVPEVNRYLMPQPWTETDSRRLFHSHLTREHPVGHGSWFWEDRATGAVVGRSHLRPCVETGDLRPEIGWFLLPAHWGSGLASEATRAVLDHAERTAGITEVIALVHIENERSLTLAYKLGFRSESIGHHYGGPHYVLRRNGTAPAPSVVDGTGAVDAN